MLLSNRRTDSVITAGSCLPSPYMQTSQSIPTFIIIYTQVLRIVISFSSQCLSALIMQHFFATITLFWHLLNHPFSSYQVREDSPPFEPLEPPWRCSGLTSMVSASLYVQPPLPLQPLQLWVTLIKQKKHLVKLDAGERGMQTPTLTYLCLVNASHLSYSFTHLPHHILSFLHHLMATPWGSTLGLKASTGQAKFLPTQTYSLLSRIAKILH